MDLNALPTGKLFLRVATKTWLIMQFTGILLTAFSLHLAARTVSQTVTLQAKDVPLETVFSEVEKQTGYVVFYNYSVIKNAAKVSVNAKNVPLDNFLAMCLKGKEFNFAIEGQTIIISPRAVLKSPSILSSLNSPPVNGVVRGTDGQPLAGINITIKGTVKGTKTDNEGKFTIDAEKGSVLLISGVGYITQEVKVDSSDLSISLAIFQASLEEVVVNKGYYTELRKLTTGSVGRVGANDISKQPVGNPLQAIYAKIPGVVITQQSGMPGGNINIQIRGQNSLRNNMNDNGNYPLYIIDGVPYFSTPLTTNAGVTLYPQGAYARGASPFNSLNPADIEAVEILKDADATAIYGSRGANGVILITTKKGKSGTMKIDANFYTGAGKITRKMSLLNTQQYLEMRKEAFKNDGIDTYGAFDYDVNGTWDQDKNHDWQDELLGGTATSTDGQLAVSGGNALSQYRFGGGYHRETSVFPGDFSDQRASGHVSLTNNSINNKFKSQITINYSAGLTNMLAQDLTGQAIGLAPNAPDMIDKEGNLLWGTGIFSNPYASTKQPYKAKSSNLITNVTLSYELFKGFYIKVNSGYTSTTLKEMQKAPMSSQLPLFQQFFPNTTNFGNSASNSWIIEPQLNYVKSMNEHSFNILAGTTFQNEERDQVFQTAKGFSSEALMDNISAVPNANVFNSYDYYKYRYNAIFGRLNYMYAEKYIVNLTGRRDGSSRFGPGKQYANFGSVGAAWILSEEEFISNALKFLDYAKLRSSYGITGNDQIPNYGFLDTYSTNGGGQYQGVSGLAPARLLNPDFRWETNKKFEVALDLDFLRNRVHITAAYFRNRSSNQLVGYSLPPTAGFPSIQYNLPATVQNTGLELELSARIIDQAKLRWSGSFNISVPRNKLIEYPNLEGSPYASTYVIGEPLAIARGFRFLGVDPQTGLYTVEDVNKDNLFNAADYVVNSFIGQRFYGGLQNTLEFKGFTLEFLLQFVKQNGRNYLTNFFNAPGSGSNQNHPVEVMNRWREEGDITSIQKFSTFYPSSYNLFASSNANVSDASFIRLKSLSLSYRFPDFIIKHIKLRDLRIYIQGQNLVTITRYRGLDPETQGTALPPLRMMTGGIQLGL